MYSVGLRLKTFYHRKEYISMRKNENPKWRIAVQLSSFHMVEVEAENSDKASEEAIEEVYKDQNYFRTGCATIVTSIMINDSESKSFATYVPEFIERSPKNGKKL